MAGSGFFGIEIILGLAVGFSVSLLGWQVNLVCIHRGLTHGRRPAFLTGIGAALGDVLVMALIFSGALSFVSHRELPGWMKWVGVAVLATIALKILFSKITPGVSSSAAEKPEVARGNLLGFLIVVTNPGIYLLWAGVWSFLLSRFSGLRDWTSFFIFIACFLCGAGLWFLILARLFLNHIQQWQETKLRILSRIIAGVMLAAAALLAFSKG